MTKSAGIALRIIAAAAVLAGLLPAQNAPPCQDRAMRTVRAARFKAAAGDSSSARKLLEQADKECGASLAVMNGIGEVYEQLGLPELAAPYRRNSNLAGRQPPGPAAPSRPKGYVRDKFALVVGIGSFNSPKIPTLKYAAKDARDFAAVLTDPEIGRFHRENVAVLTDTQATTVAIRSALADIAGKAMQDDLVVLYFSTHGSSPSMDSSKIGSGYVVTHDTQVDKLYGTAYGMDELGNFMKQKLRAERIVAFLDTCYSGDTARTIEGSKLLVVDNHIPDESIGRIAQGKGSVVITSSTSRELSWESDEKQNSFFTLYLVDSLRERKGLGDVRQLYTDIQRKIPAAVQAYTRQKGLGDGGRGLTQNPVIYPRSDIPDIVIGTPLQ
ncbi:MAG: caspase family protein [Bryobacteraceae bacterium]